MGKKQRVIRIFLDRTFEEKNYETDQNLVKYDGKETRFEPACVITERKSGGSRWKFWRKLKSARNLIFFVDGLTEAIRFAKTTKNMQPFWTQKEAHEFANKMTRKALTEYKPMKWSQFIILLIVNLIVLGVVVLIGKRFGAF